MSDFNLPPGCRSSDIPGNRPQDIVFEKWLDQVFDLDETISINNPGLYEYFERGLSPEEAVELLK